MADGFHRHRTSTKNKQRTWTNVFVSDSYHISCEHPQRKAILESMGWTFDCNASRCYVDIAPQIQLFVCSWTHQQNCSAWVVMLEAQECRGLCWIHLNSLLSLHLLPSLSPRLSFEVWPDVPWLWKSVQNLLFVNIFLERSVWKCLFQFDGSKSHWKLLFQQASVECKNMDVMRVPVRLALLWTSLGLILGNHGSRLSRFSRLERKLCGW